MYILSQVTYLVSLGIGKKSVLKKDNRTHLKMTAESQLKVLKHFLALKCLLSIS